MNGWMGSVHFPRLLVGFFKPSGSRFNCSGALIMAEEESTTMNHVNLGSGMGWQKWMIFSRHLTYTDELVEFEKQAVQVRDDFGTVFEVSTEYTLG